MAACGVLLISGAARADDMTTPSSEIPGGFSMQAVGSETGVWQSNPLLQIGSHKSLYGSVTTPELLVNDKTPTSLLGADVSLVQNLFNQSSFNSTDLHDKINLNTQTQRWSAGVQEQTDYDTTRTSELFPAGANGVILDEPVRHTGMSVSPNIAFSPETTDRYALNGSFSASTYDNSIFSNYQTYSVAPSYTHSFDPLNSGTISLQAQRYQTTTGAHLTDDTIGPTIGWNGILTPRLTAKATFGLQEERQYGSGTSSQPWTLQYDFTGDLIFKGEQDKTDLAASRTNYPFASGVEALLTSVSINETHDLNQNFSLNFLGSYQTASYQASATGNLDDLATVGGGLTYHATDRLDVAASYQYRYETLTNLSANAQDHTVTLGLVYHPRAWTL